MTIEALACNLFGLSLGQNGLGPHHVKYTAYFTALVNIYVKPI